MTDDVEPVIMNSALGPINNATSDSEKSPRGICAVSCGEEMKRAVEIIAFPV